MMLLCISVMSFLFSTNVHRKTFACSLDDVDANKTMCKQGKNEQMGFV